MRATALAVLILASMAASNAVANGTLMVYSDPAYTSAALENDLGPVSVYVVHEGTFQMQSARYQVYSESTTLVWVADVNPHTQTTGTSQTGVTVVYDGCLSSPVLVQEIQYMGDGSSPVGSCISIAHVQGEPVMVVTHCDGSPRAPSNAGVCVKCTPPAFGDCMELPVETSTWGRVKGLYR